MKLSDFIGQTVFIDGVDKPVVLVDLSDGRVGYYNDSGAPIQLGRISDSVGDSGSTHSIRLSRIQG